MAFASYFRRCGRILRTDFRAGLGWILLAQSPQQFLQGDLAQIERRRTGQKFVENDAQRVNIGAGIYILTRGERLLRTHIFRSPDDGAYAGEQGIGSEFLGERLGHAEVDNFGGGLAIHFRDENTGWLQVAMDNGFLMRMLHAFADVYE